MTNPVLKISADEANEIEAQAVTNRALAKRLFGRGKTPVEQRALRRSTSVSVPVTIDPENVLPPPRFQK